MAMLFTVLLCLSSAVLGYFSYYFNRGHYIQGAGTVIDTEIQYLVTADERDNLIKFVNWAATRKDRIYYLSDPLKNRLAGNLKKVPEKLNILTEGMLIFTQNDKDYAAKIHLFPDSRTLLVGIDITDAGKSYRMMQWLSLLSIALMAIVICISFLISTFVVSRTNKIAITAKSIMDTGDLSKRIVIDNRWDDLSHMAYVLNAFLERVEKLMQGIRRVSDNIAHDLRTPLTRLLNDLESLRDDKAIASDDTSVERCELLISEANGLLSTFNALLRIANIETGKQRQSFKQVDLEKISLDVIELYEPLAESKNIVIRHKTVPASWIGDRDLLFQTFANLLDNAIKFSPLGTEIVITLVIEGKRPIFRIADNGPGITTFDKEKIFDRFYRADTSRTSEGNGLGLSLVAAILELHRAEITMEDQSPGILFKIAF